MLTFVSLVFFDRRLYYLHNFLGDKALLQSLVLDAQVTENLNWGKPTSDNKE